MKRAIKGAVLALAASGAWTGTPAQDAGGATRGLPVLGQEWRVCDREAFPYGCTRVFQVYTTDQDADIHAQRFVYVPPMVLERSGGRILSVSDDGLEARGRIIWDQYGEHSSDSICRYLVTSGPGQGPAAGLEAARTMGLGTSQIEPIQVTWAKFQSEEKYGLSGIVTDGAEFDFSEHGPVPFVLRGKDPGKVRQFVDDFERNYTSIKFQYAFFTFDTKVNRIEVKASLKKEIEESLDASGEGEGVLKTHFLSRAQLYDLVSKVSSKVVSRSVREIESDEMGVIAGVMQGAVNRLLSEQASSESTFKDIAWDAQAFKSHVIRYQNRVRNETDRERFLRELGRLDFSVDEADYRKTYSRWAALSGIVKKIPVSISGGAAGREKDAWASGESRAEIVRLLKDALKATSSGVETEGEWWVSPDMDLYRIDSQNLDTLAESVTDTVEVFEHRRTREVSLRSTTVARDWAPERTGCPSVHAEEDPKRVAEERAQAEIEAYKRRVQEQAKIAEAAEARKQARSARIADAIRRAWEGVGCPAARGLCVRPGESRRIVRLGRAEFDWLVVPHGASLRINVPAGVRLSLTAHHALIGGKLIVDADGEDGARGRDGRDGSDRTRSRGVRGRSGGGGGDGRDAGNVILRLGIVASTVAPGLLLPNPVDQLDGIRIRARGGDGGHGGHGGNGGEGGDATCLMDGWHDAKPGGNGGDGGDGGAGGRGGNVSVGMWLVTLEGGRTLDQGTMQKQISIRTEGGDEGRGGGRGDGGRGGAGTPCYAVLPVPLIPPMTVLLVPPMKLDKPSGAHGRRGDKGGMGSQGADGIAQVRSVAAPDPEGIRCEWDRLGAGLSDADLRCYGQS